MMRLPGYLPSLVIACLASAFLSHVPSALAQAAPGPDKAVAQAAEDFWHFASVGRYDLASAQAQRLTSGTWQPRDVLAAFEAVVDERNSRLPADRRLDLYDRILGWQRVPELADACAQLISIFDKAKALQFADPAFIEQNVRRLGGGQRAFLLAVQQLKGSGELAVPTMLRYLKDPDHRELQVHIRRAMAEMGLRVVNPLLAATEMDDWNTLTWVIWSLGDVGYDTALPYLARLAHSPQTPQTIKNAAVEAMMRLRLSDPLAADPAQLFYELAEKLYYDRAAIRVPFGTEPVAHVWRWAGGQLERIDIPAAVFNEQMALRACEYALKLNPSRGDAVSLWLAAAYKREVELPPGAVDPLWPPTQPPTHYYAVASGAGHLGQTLARALRDHDSAIALKAAQSIKEIAGNANLFAIDGESPVISAMHYPDRLVRFEAAIAVAQALPQQPFPGQERVVPTLAEALAQTGKPGALVLGESQDVVNQLSGSLSGAYSVRGGTTAEAVVAAAQDLPGIDVLVIREGHPQADLLLSLAAQHLRLARVPRLILVTSVAASPYALEAQTNPLLNLTATGASDSAALTAAADQARRRGGTLPLDEKTAAAYALRAAQLLGQLAISRGQVLDLVPAHGAILAALDDPRPDISRAAGNVLAAIGTDAAQTALLLKATAEQTPDSMKIGFFKDLSLNAKLFGNRLSASHVEALLKVVDGAQNLEVRAAAAEAHGALNLSADHVKTLILKQAR